MAHGCDYNGGMPRYSKYPGSMTARQFAKAAKQASASPTTLTRARRVLVDGKSARDVASSDGVTVYAVYKVIYKIY